MTELARTAADVSRWPGLDSPLSRDPLFWASLMVWGLWIAVTDPIEAGWVIGVTLIVVGLPSALLVIGTLAGSVRAFARGLR